MMSAASSQERPIQTKAQLLVEGRTSEIFFWKMTEQLGLTSIQVRDFGSINELDAYLAVFSRNAKFEEVVGALGIIRDAEQNPAEAAFASVCSSLQKSKLPIPTKINSVEGGEFKTGVFILPDCSSPGMLENLCLESVGDKPEVHCLEDYFACIEKRGGTLPRNMTKAKAFAFLAAQDLNEPLIGTAAKAKIWPWEHPAFAMLQNFLRALNNA
jgi:hypothetical protein